MFTDHRKNCFCKKILLYVMTVCAGLISCLFTEVSDNGSFSMSIANKADTLPPRPVITICFSTPVVASDPRNLRFDFDPPFDDYYIALNASHDTARIVCTGTLSGAVRYVLRVHATPESVDGVDMEPGRDSVEFMTYPVEREPNDKAGCADSIGGVIYGMIDRADDTDWFLLGDSTRAVVAASEGGATVRCTIKSANGETTPVSGMCIDPDTVRVPGSFARPVYACVVSFTKASGGMYKCEALNDLSDK